MSGAAGSSRGAAASSSGGGGGGGLAKDPCTTCPGCQTALLHPPNVQVIKCPVCSTVTSLRPQGGAHAQQQVQSRSICSGCGRWLLHPAGVPSIKCTICSAITNLAQPQAQTTCFNCGTAMMYPKGAPCVKCFVCHKVTSVPVQFRVSEKLIQDLVGQGVARSRVVAAVKRNFEEGRSADDLAGIHEQLALVTATPVDLPAYLHVMQGSGRASAADALSLVAGVWSSPYVLTYSFLAAPEIPATPENPGLNLDAVRAAYRAVLDANSRPLTEALARAVTTLLSRQLMLMELADLRIFLIVLELPLLEDPSFDSGVMARLSALVSSLSTEYKNILISWLAKYPSEAFHRVLNVLQLQLSLRFIHAPRNWVPHTDWQVITTTQTLGLLNVANQNAGHVSFTEFYNVTLNDTLKAEADFERWRQGAGTFSFCHHPFILNPAFKSNVMRLDAQQQMESELQAAVVSMLFNGQANSPFLVLVVRRDHIVQDTLDQIAGKKWDLKKKLKVKFHGEEGIDAGGVQKEFFQLIMREIFDPKYGMFEEEPDSHLFWFNKASFENDLEYELIGVVLGLAIYNSVILDLHLPMVVYKKLMGYVPTLDDFAQLCPSLTSGLRQLLEYDGDVENDLCRTFEITYNVWGETLRHELKPGGAQIPVTTENRREFVDLYVRWYLSQSVEKQFVAFSRGFHRVCGGQALSLFRPEELELLICGSTNLDFKALQQHAKYENGYHASHKLVKWFWEMVLNEFAPDERKKLLFFVTGSDRVPIKGLGTLDFVIIRNGGDSDRLPTSHTCFNQLLIPEYKTKQKLSERLKLAIENAQGFGLK